MLGCPWGLYMWMSWNSASVFVACQAMCKDITEMSS